MNEDERWQRLIDGLRAGEPQVLNEFCTEYGPALHRYADKLLPARVQRRVGPEDVVQSACRTFLRRAQEGQFQLPDAEALWRLVCAITLAKVREQTRFHLRQKRGLQREVEAQPAAGDDSLASFPLAAREPSPAEVAEFSDQFRQLMAGFDEEERQIVDLKLQEFTNDEIAQKLGCSERTVRRLMKRIQSELLRAFDLTA